MVNFCILNKIFTKNVQYSRWLSSLLNVLKKIHSITCVLSVLIPVVFRTICFRKKETFTLITLCTITRNHVWPFFTTIRYMSNIQFTSLSRCWASHFWILFQILSQFTVYPLTNISPLNNFENIFLMSSLLLLLFE